MILHCSNGFEDLVLKLLLVIVLIAIFGIKFRLTDVDGNHLVWGASNGSIKGKIFLSNFDTDLNRTRVIILLVLTYHTIGIC
jgi:hypothetical protein